MLDALTDYERRMEPIARLEVFGQMAQACGIRSTPWAARLNERLTLFILTDRDTVTLRNTLTDAERAVARRYLKEYEGGIYAVVIGRDPVSGCKTLAALPVLSLADTVADAPRY